MATQVTDTNSTAGAELGRGDVWALDPSESSAEFAVKHFWGLITVHGSFDRLDGVLIVDGDGSRAELTAAADSVNTGRQKRDEHLRSADFFDAERHSTVAFYTPDVTKIVGAIPSGSVTIGGQLTAAGRSIPVQVEAEVELQGDRLVIDGRTVVDRTELGMTWSPLGIAKREAALRVKAVLVGVRRP